MPFFVNVPLTIAPLIVYNIIAFGLFGTDPGNSWVLPVATIPLPSDARWSLLLGDLMIAAALFLLFFEILKATRVGRGSVIDHILSALVFIIYLVEFLVVREGATSVFFILLLISLLDMIAGFTVAIHAARRDIAFGPGERS
ncbi:hypothetical protein C8N35_1011374 [Breoghania corrubedonensis]|uniref:Uncharacterized protein n=1 Tax=Breoghania corrubedonensis TaxID=665038 RepID=A0A2T5VHU2_9HYPH|nr:hypothetical protein [Breoghania corrubedonensis]PTW63323.1 hypothetical protein C8N35_1011374 [Breoghania corrubedonensis]